MANIGFLGLGILGAPMTLRLIEAGHQVTVWSHNQDKAARFAAANRCALGKPRRKSRGKVKLFFSA